MHHPIPRTTPPRSTLPAAATVLAASIAALALAAPAALADTVGAEGSASPASPASSANAPSTEPAVWVQKKINFIYQGFTTHYSCEGLESAVKSVLLQLGARKSDLNVHETGCVRSLGRPEPFPGVVGTFWVLEPAAKAADVKASKRSNGNTGKTSGQEHPVKAEWQTVKVRVGQPGLDQSGQCELIDQVKRHILPLFTARDVKFESSCVPYQLTIAGSRLQAQVLKAPAAGKELAQAPGSGKAE